MTHPFSALNSAKNAEMNVLRGKERRQVYALAERDAKIAILRAFGKTNAEIAVITATGKKAVDWQIQSQKPFIDAITDFVAEHMLKPVQITIEGEELDINSEEYTAHAQKRLGKMLKVIDRALISNDLKMAVEAAKEMHKVLGLTTKTKVEHTVDHIKRVIHDVTPAMAQLVNNLHARKQLPPAFKEIEVVSTS